jgi:HSP20 family molecular chaperone IbpA
MTKLAHVGAFTRFPDVLDFGDSTWAAMLPFWRQTFLIEDYVEEGRYVIRAEVAGLDADKNIDVNVQDRMLTIRAERHEEHREGRRSEFRYGSMSRTVELPSRAEKDKITATYDKGILEITVPLSEVKPSGRQIEVMTAG